MNQNTRSIFPALLLFPLVSLVPHSAHAHEPNIQDDLVDPGLDQGSDDCSSLTGIASAQIGQWFCSRGSTQDWHPGTPRAGYPAPKVSGDGFLAMTPNNQEIAETWQKIDLGSRFNARYRATFSAYATSSSPVEATAGVGLMTLGKGQIIQARGTQGLLDNNTESWQPISTSFIIAPEADQLVVGLFSPDDGPDEDPNPTQFFFDEAKLDIQRCVNKTLDKFVDNHKFEAGSTGQRCALPVDENNTPLGSSTIALLSDETPAGFSARGQLGFSQWGCDNAFYTDPSASSDNPSSTPSGQRYLEIRQSASGEWSTIRQRLDLSVAVPDSDPTEPVLWDANARLIDMGGMRANFNTRIYATDNDVRARLRIVPLDESGNPIPSDQAIGSHDPAQVFAKSDVKYYGFAEGTPHPVPNQWVDLAANLELPVGTRSIVIEVSAKNNSLTGDHKLFVDNAILSIERCIDFNSYCIVAGQAKAPSGILAQGEISFDGNEDKKYNQKPETGLAVLIGGKLGQNLRYRGVERQPPVKDADRYIYTGNADLSKDEYVYYVVKPDLMDDWQGLLFEVQLQSHINGSPILSGGSLPRARAIMPPNLTININDVEGSLDAVAQAIAQSANDWTGVAQLDLSLLKNQTNYTPDPGSFLSDIPQWFSNDETVVWYNLNGGTSASEAFEVIDGVNNENVVIIRVPLDSCGLVCGNGVLDHGEECDPGPGGDWSDPGCTDRCQIPKPAPALGGAGLFALGMGLLGIRRVRKHDEA